MFYRYTGPAAKWRHMAKTGVERRSLNRGLEGAVEGEHSGASLGARACCHVLTTGSGLLEDPARTMASKLVLLRCCAVLLLTFEAGLCAGAATRSGPPPG